MKTGRIVLFLMVLSILWCADVFAHGKGTNVMYGNPYEHIFVRAPSNDPCEGSP